MGTASEGLKELDGQIGALLAMHETGNLVPRVPNLPIELLRSAKANLPALIECVEALKDAEGAIASLEPADLGGIYDKHNNLVGEVRDELLAKIRAALSKLSTQPPA